MLGDDTIHDSDQRSEQFTAALQRRDTRELLVLAQQAHPHLSLTDNGQDAFLVLPLIDKAFEELDDHARSKAQHRLARLLDVELGSIGQLMPPWPTVTGTSTVDALRSGTDPATFDDWQQPRAGLQRLAERARIGDDGALDTLRTIQAESSSTDFRFAAAVELAGLDALDCSLTDTLVASLGDLDAQRFQRDGLDGLLADHHTAELQQTINDLANDSTRSDARYWRYWSRRLTDDGFDPITNESDYQQLDA